MYNHQVASFEENSKLITIKSLALPLILKSFFLQLISTLSAMVLSGYSQAAVSATTVANQICTLPQAVLQAIPTGTVILASIALGKRKRDDSDRICGNGIIAAFILSFVVGALLFFYSDDLTHMMNLKGTTQKMSAVFLRVVSIGMPIQIMYDTFQQLLICNGHSRVVIYSGIATGTFNVLGSLLVLYIIPCNDMFAIGLVTCLSWLVGLLIALLFFMKYKCTVKFSFDLKKILKILKLGLPAGMCLISYNFSNTVTTGFLAGMGETVLNTKVYINNIVAYVPMIGYGIASANSVIMGRHCGGGRYDSMNILYKQNLKLIMLLNLCLSVAVLIFYKPLLSIFTEDAAVYKLAFLVFLIDIPLEVARGVNNVSECSLNPCGDIKITLIASIIAAWLGSVLLGYVLGVRLSLELVGLWIAFMVSEMSKAIIYIFRWKSGKWRAIKI